MPRPASSPRPCGPNAIITVRAKTKKLVATIGILIWLPVYAVIAMRIGLAVLPNAGAFTTFMYYAITGTAWILPIGLLLPWMHRDP